MSLEFKHPAIADLASIQDTLPNAARVLPHEWPKSSSPHVKSWNCFRRVVAVAGRPERES